MMVRECCFPEWEQEIWLYLDEELPEEDRIRLERHLEHCARCREFLVDIQPVEDCVRRHLGDSAAEPLPETFTDEVMSHLPAMISPPRYRQVWLSLQRNLTPRAVVWMMRQHPLTVAALFLLCLGSLFSVWLGQMDEDYRVRLIAGEEGPFLVRLSESISCQNPGGKLYVLPDESLLFAHPGAIFSIEAYQNNGDDRWVHLKRGEIWLDVQTKAKEGFTVSTPEARVKVMGTCFAVSVKQRQTCVEVARGSVLVENVGGGHPKSCRLHESERILADKRGRLIEFGHVDRHRVSEVRAPFEAIRSEKQPPSPPKPDEPLIKLPG